jgi:hypothetical protein
MWKALFWYKPNTLYLFHWQVTRIGNMEISHSYWKCEKISLFPLAGHNFGAILWLFSLILSHFVPWLILARALSD